MSPPGTVPVRAPLPEEQKRYALDPSLLMQPGETEQSLLPYLRLLWKYRSFLLRVGVCAMLASALIAILIPVRYQAVTRLMPPEGQSSGLGLLAAMAGGNGAGGVSGLAGLTGLAGDALGVRSSGALFVGIVNSRTVQDALINRFQLMKEYHDTKIEDARTDLSQHTDVSEDRKNGIISIAVIDHDPNRAAAMAESYVKELDRLVAHVSTSSARRERIFLEERLQEVKKDLDAAAKSFSEFASKNTAIDIPAQGKAMVEAAAILQGQLIAAESQVSGLRQIYTNTNVRVRAAEARVEELKRKLNEIGGAGTQGDLKNDNSLYPSIRKLPLLGVTYADLYRQTKVQETVFELLTQQYELAKVQEAKEIPTVKVLDPAIVPTKKSFPPRRVITLLGTFLGLMLATAWTIGRVRWEAVDENDPRKEFATEVFTTLRASLPKFSRNGSADANGHHLGRQPRKAEGSSKEGEEQLKG